MNNLVSTTMNVQHFVQTSPSGWEGFVLADGKIVYHHDGYQSESKASRTIAYVAWRRLHKGGRLCGDLTCPCVRKDGNHE